MAILHVRNVPDDLYERVRMRAEAEGRSMSAEVISLIARALDEPTRSPGDVISSIRRRRHFRPADVGAPDSISLLRADRER